MQELSHLNAKKGFTKRVYKDSITKGVMRYARWVGDYSEGR